MISVDFNWVSTTSKDWTELKVSSSAKFEILQFSLDHESLVAFLSLLCVNYEYSFTLLEGILLDLAIHKYLKSFDR